MVRSAMTGREVVRATMPATSLRAVGRGSHVIASPATCACRSPTRAIASSAVSRHTGNLEILGACERQTRVEHAGTGPFDQLLPHLADQNERDAVHVTHLQELPDHERLEHRADAAGTTTKASEAITKWCSRVKNVSCSKACSTKGLTSCSNGRSTRMPTDPVAPARRRALVGGLHESGATARHDVAAHRRERGRRALHLLVDERAGLGACRSEDRDAIAVSLRRPKLRERVHDLPQVEDTRARRSR